MTWTIFLLHGQTATGFSSESGSRVTPSLIMEILTQQNPVDCLSVLSDFVLLVWHLSLCLIPVTSNLQLDSVLVRTSLHGLLTPNQGPFSASTSAQVPSYVWCAYLLGHALITICWISLVPNTCPVLLLCLYQLPRFQMLPGQPPSSLLLKRNLNSCSF